MIFAALTVSSRHVEVDKMFALIVDGAKDIAGIGPSSQVVRGIVKIFESSFPIQISESTEVSRLENFDLNKLPWFSSVVEKTVTTTTIDPVTLTQVVVHDRVAMFVDQFGYAKHIVAKMLETLEIAVWATILSIILSLPLAYQSAISYANNRVTYYFARAFVALCRAIPELISAMFLVVAFGFGPIAGILALAIHSAGFLGKFFAEDIENADKGPQEALIAIGVSKPIVLRYAVIPQVLPQYVAYILYILDRNVRMATVIGIVGAGGIGQELKGRFDMFDYGHVTTILLAIFITVFMLDRCAAYMRKQLI
jgi:phosphonate transport system permease protein